MKSNERKLYLITFILAIFAVLIIPSATHAAGLVPCGGNGEKPCTVVDAFVLIARVTNWLVALAGAYAVYQVVNAGFWLITTMGNEESVTKRRKALTQAVVGFVFAMLGFLFVNTAVNFILRSRCKVDLRNPMTYITITNYNDCRSSDADDPSVNPINEELKTK
ncbi:MAG: pilin [Patescibacteria group bacterium]|nr:pilin [Patescibacteria group bacterium]